MSPPKLVVSNVKKYDVSKMCRSCSKEVFKRTSVLTKLLVNTEVLTVSEMLETCTSLKIGIADGLPTILCQTCLHALVNAYKFIKKCKKSDVVLRQFVTDGKTTSLNSLQKSVDQKTIILLDSTHKCYKPILPKKIEDIKSSSKSENAIKSIKPVLNINRDVDKKIDSISKNIETDTKNDLIMVNNIKEDRVVTKNFEGKNFEECKISNKIDSIIKENNKIISNNPQDSLIIAKINSLIKENDKIVSNKDVEKQIFKRKMREISKNNNIDILDPPETESNDQEINILEVKSLEPEFHQSSTNIKLEENDSDEDYTIEENTHVVINFDHDYVAKIENSDKTKQCPHCLIFFLIEDFTDHVKKHGNDPIFECNLCPKTFKNVNQLNWHHKQHYVDKVYNCSCNITFKLRDEYLDHMKTHKIFSCVSCEKVFDQEESFELHKQMHLEENNFICDICDKKFTQKKYLDGHKRRNHATGEKSYLCKVCGKSFYLLSQLNKHEKLHNRIKRFFICDICNKVLKTKEGWDEHKQHHLRKGKEFACDICNKKFSFPRYLLLHKRRRHLHDLPNQENICSACGKIFNLRSQLSIHEKIHAKDRKIYSCSLCDRELLSLGSLKKHEIIYHRGSEKKFKCSMCPQKFMFKEKLQEHTRRHKGDYSHNCNQCDKKFYAATELRAHMRNHTGERPYQCPYCTASYMRCQTLNEHVRTHTGERPYSCEMCGKNYARLNSYRRHQKICNRQILTGNADMSE